MNIATNNVPRDVIDASELAAAERAQFDYLDWPAIDAGTDSASFFRYRGELHDLGEFPGWSGSARWHGFRADTYFSGLAVRYAEDFEHVVVARVSA